MSPEAEANKYTLLYCCIIVLFAQCQVLVYILLNHFNIEDPTLKKTKQTKTKAKHLLGFSY